MILYSFDDELFDHIYFVHYKPYIVASDGINFLPIFIT